MMSRRHPWALAWVAALAAAPAGAADSEGRFMVKGAGTATCGQFLAAQEARGREFVSFAGWLDGYLTHINQREPATFDIAPWQGTELVLAAVSGQCRKDPKVTFHQAAYQVAQGLGPGRLLARSEVVTARVGDQSVVLYREIVVRIQQRLRLRGLLATDPTGDYDEATVRAVRAFQASRKLAETGLPDQVTLANLL
jgi:hypothetical protein